MVTYEVRTSVRRDLCANTPPALVPLILLVDVEVPVDPLVSALAVVVLVAALLDVGDEALRVPSA